MHNSTTNDRTSDPFKIKSSLNDSPSTQAQWEYSVVLALRKEFKNCCYRSQLNLPPTTLVLFDSEIYWGQFDPMKRTISISKKLVREHPWYHVTGVLKHEMAHLYAQVLSSESEKDYKPHGDIFHLACRRLGVPSLFTRSQINLQSCNLDWRQDENQETLHRDKILERAKKLLSLASSSNVHEAQLAMEKVLELYAKYNLEHLSELSKMQFVHTVISTGKRKRVPWEIYIIGILIQHFFVEVILVSPFDQQLQCEVQGIELIGTSENVLMAEYVYHFLLQQVETLLHEEDRKHKRLNIPPLSRMERTSFRVGILQGFDKKLTEAQKKSGPSLKSRAAHDRTYKGTTTDSVFPSFSQSGQKNESTQGSHTLTLIGQAQHQFANNTFLKQYLKIIYPKLRMGSSSSLSIHRSAFSAGVNVGESLTLNKPITQSQGALGKLLIDGTKPIKFR